MPSPTGSCHVAPPGSAVDEIDAEVQAAVLRTSLMTREQALDILGSANDLTRQRSSSGYG